MYGYLAIDALGSRLVISTPSGPANLGIDPGLIGAEDVIGEIAIESAPATLLGEGLTLDERGNVIYDEIDPLPTDEYKVEPLPIGKVNAVFNSP